jgi:hypothetical protein
VNADGFADVVVADPGGPSALCDVTGTPLGGSFEKLLEPTARPGGVYVYSGHEGDLLYELHGEAKNDRFGVSVASAGDADQDGFGDLVVGAGRGLPYVARIHAGPKGKLSTRSYSKNDRNSARVREWRRRGEPRGRLT